MQSYAWANGQYREAEPPSQSSLTAAQITHNTMRNQQARTAYTGVLPQSDNPYGNGAYSNRQPSNWQTSALLHHAVSSQQPAKRNSHLVDLLIGNLQHSSTHTQGGNPSLLTTCGSQQDFHQNSAPNTLTESPFNLLKGNTTYPQQYMPAHRNQPVKVHWKQSTRAQDGNALLHFQHHEDPNSLFYNVNGESTKPVSAYTSTGTSTSLEELVPMGTLGPPPPYNRQTAHNQNHRQNGTQHGFIPITPSSYNTAISQSYRNNNITTNSLSSGQNLHVSSTSQTSQQCSTNKNGRETNSSINSNFCTEQYEIAMIARIADDLRESYTAASDSRSAVYTSSPYGRKQFVSEVRGRNSYQNVQPVMSTVSESYTSNASQSLPFNSEQFLPKTSHSVMLTQHSVDVLSQQNSEPNVFPFTSTGCGHESKAEVRSSNDASQVIQVPESISLQTNETQSFVANNCETLEMLSSVKSSDSSIHSSPGRTRAVAVVQPLSHESYQVASKRTCSDMTSQSTEGSETDDSLSNPRKLFSSPKNGSYPYLENPNQMTSNTSAIRHPGASNDRTLVSSPDSARPQDLLQKQLYGTGSKPAISMQVDQCVAQAAKQSVTSEVQMSQSGDDKDKSEMPSDPRGISEHFIVPTAPWTPDALTKLIAKKELKNCTKFDPARRLLVVLFNMFWNRSIKKFLGELQTCKNIMADAENFCREHVTPESVILSQVKCQFSRLNKSFHVLKDNEVYSELPYRSSWLNVNEQLDDIDKEFDFPQSLKRHLHTLVSDSQPDQAETNIGILAQIESEVSNKIELNPVDSSEKIQDSTVEDTSIETASPNELESAESSDPYDKIEIHILPPEEARVIFEQLQSKQQQSEDMDSQPERVTNGFVEGDLPMVIDATLSDTKEENESICPIEDVCCIARFREIVWGPDSLIKCQCKYNQSQDDTTENTLQKEEMAVQKNDDLSVMRSDNNFHSATEEESQVKAGENVSNQVMTLCWPEPCNELRHTNDLTEGDDKLYSYSGKEPKNISQRSINSSQSSIIILSESTDDLFSDENEIPNQMPDLESDSERAQVELTESSYSGGSDDKENKEFFRGDTAFQSDPEVDCLQDQLKSTGNTQSCTSDNSGKEFENLSSSESKDASQMSDLEKNCRRAQLISANVTSSETEEKQTEISATSALQTARSGRHETLQRKRERTSSNDTFSPVFRESKKYKSFVGVDSQPALECASKCGKFFVADTDSKLSASNVRTAELVLFGSTQQDKWIIMGGRKRHFSSTEAVSDAVLRAPRVLTVKLNPLKRNSSETGPGQHSIKHWLYEKWRRSIPPCKMRNLSKLKTKKRSPKNAETVHPISTKELPVPSDMRNCRSAKKRRSVLNKLKHGEEETKGHTVKVNQPAAHKRSKAENRSQAVTPRLDNDVLKFSVLPTTFNFSDGSDRRKDTNDPVQDKPGHTEGQNKSNNKTVKGAKGIWLPNTEKKYRPLFKPCSLFHEFQKKYNKKKQPSMDQ